MKTRRILLVDDDGLVLSTFGKGLKDSGYSVGMADSGEQAIRLVRNELSFDLAILDMRMPGFSGVETARVLAQFNVPVIFLSAYDNEKDVKQAVDEGALAYLVKPIDVEKAIPTIETALQRAMEIRHLRDTETRLDSALETGNRVNVAVGILMERHRLDRTAAFEVLRKKARSEQRKVRDVADEMLNSWYAFNL